MKHTARILRRLFCALMALLMLTALAAAENTAEPKLLEELVLSDNGALSIVQISEEGALAEESALDAFDAQPGDYEWYILPTEPVDGYAYVDIYPCMDVVFAEDGSWTYSFTIEEVLGIEYQPYVLTIICFAGSEEVSRESYPISTLMQWWRDNAILCSSSVIYEGTIRDQDITGVALSIIGIDEFNYEQEFHSLIDLRTLSENIQ